MSQLTGDLKNDWNLLLSKINNFAIRMLLSNVAKPVEITPNKLKIEITNKEVAKQAQKMAETPAIQSMLIEVFGQLPEIEIV